MMPTPPNTELAEAIKLEEALRLNPWNRMAKENMDIILEAARAHLATLRGDGGGVNINGNYVPVTNHVAVEPDYRKGIAYRNGYEEGYAAGAKNEREWVNFKSALKNPSDAGGETIETHGKK